MKPKGASAFGRAYHSGSLDEGKARSSLRYTLVIVLTALFALNMVSLTAAKHQDGGATVGFHFEYVTVTLLQEAFKLCVAFYCFRREFGDHRLLQGSWTSSAVPWNGHRRDTSHARGSPDRRRPNEFRPYDFLLFAIPGVLYCLDTNFQYIILGFLEPTELAILWNFKVFATAVLLHNFLNRRYTQGQWMALLLLIIGCALTQASDGRHPHGLPKADGVATVAHSPQLQADSQDVGVTFFDVDNSSNSSNAGDPILAAAATERSVSLFEGVIVRPSAKLIGACLAILGSSVAASSNVFCEWLVKQHPEDSVNFQMMQLYTFGVAMNLCTLVVKASSEADSPVNGEGGFFAGYTFWVWAVVFIGAASGLIISITLKYVDNIAVVFAHAVAVLVAAVVSTGLFDLKLSAPFAAGGILILIALVTFHAAEHTDSDRARSVSLGLSESEQDRPMYCLGESQ